MAYPRLSDVIPLGEWLPDQTSFNNAGAIVVKNVAPYGKGYIPFRALQPSSGTLSGIILGGFACVDRSGSPHFFVATSTKLYKLISNAWQDVTRTSGGDYNTNSGERWVFTQYGDNVIASNYSDFTQRFDLGTSTNFANLAGSPPQARVLAVVNNFVVTGDTFDAIDDERPARIRWSGFDNVTEWTPSVVTQADLQDLATGGPVRAIIGYDNYAIILQYTAIKRLEYIGGSDIFSISDIEPNRGCFIAGTVAATGREIFYYGEDGFFQFSNQSMPIGHGKVDRWFASNADFESAEKFTSTIDPRSKSYVLSFVSNDSPDGNPDLMLIYHWVERRWSLINMSMQRLFTSYSRSLSIDDLDAIYGDLDSIPTSLDATEFKGGRPLIAAVTTTGAIGSFSGDTLQAEIETTEVQLNPQGRALVQEIQPITDASSVTVTIKFRDKLADSEMVGDTAVLNAYTGSACLRKDARYHRANMVIPAGTTWTFFDGVKLAFRGTGIR
jgi:hypothetical protein